MIIAGLTHNVGADSSCSIIIDGRLHFYCEEERFTRQKHAFNQIPHRALQCGLEHCEILPEDIEEFAIGFDRPDDGVTFGSAALAERIGLNPRELFDFHDKTLRNQFVSRHYCDHYVSHAMSAAPYLSGEPANILVVDGWGGNCSGAGFSKSAGDELKREFDIPIEQSVGLFYQFVTAHLGFTPHSQEGKTMALAAYGEVDETTLPDFCEAGTGLPELGKYVEFLQTIEKRGKQSEITQVHKNLAATAQFYLERSVIKLARKLHRATGHRVLGLAGGVALNCVANGKLAVEPFVDRLVVPPVAHDGGVSLGAAVARYFEKTGALPSIPLDHAYWGPVYAAEEVSECVRRAKLGSMNDDPVEIAVKSLLSGEVVAVFCSGAEAGPRALGARSIIANPLAEGMSDRINAGVKNRELWRPFAPVILADRQDEFMMNSTGSPFMTCTDRLKPEWREALSCVSHIDGTTRPQVIGSEATLYGRILQRFYDETGVPILVNTSFNQFDEPIVLRPDHAIATFYRSGLDTLVFDELALRK